MDQMTELWNTRYRSKEYIYGKDPNQFFKDSLNRLDLTGKILLPAEGEGRNAVYAAQKGLSVHAFDISGQAKTKALDLAREMDVKIHYEVGEITELVFEDDSFDSAALIFIHLPPQIRSGFHREIKKLIKPGGLVILESFSKDNLQFRQNNQGIGGPNKIEMLFSKEEIESDFNDFEIIELKEVQVDLQEGILHNGIGKVIRFIGRKPSDR